MDTAGGSPGQPTTFTFAISTHNTTPQAVPLQGLLDLLPPDFTYVTGSSGGLWDFDPEVDWMQQPQRYQLEWDINGAVAVPAGQTVIQTLQATATFSSGCDYSNEAWVEWDQDDCQAYPPGGGISYTGPTAFVEGSLIFDIESTPGTSRVRSRIMVWPSTESIQALSWQIS